MTIGTAPQCTLFTTPGAFVFNVPADRSMVWVTLQAAGSGGMGGDVGAFFAGGGGGGAGECCVHIPYAVTPGGTVAGVVGAGGAGGAIDEGFGVAGEDTTFGNLRVNGAPQPPGFGQTYRGGSKGGGRNGAIIGNDFGRIGAADGAKWFGGSSGGPDQIHPAQDVRRGGPAGGRAAAACGPEPSGGGASGATIFAVGATGATGQTTGNPGLRGAGGGGGGGGSAAKPGGTGGNGYVLIEYF